MTKKVVEKKRTSMRLTDNQKLRIIKKYSTIQAFVDDAYKQIFGRKKKWTSKNRKKLI